MRSLITIIICHIEEVNKLITLFFYRVLQADVLVSSRGACDKAIIKAGGPQGATPKVGDIAVSGGFSSVSHVIHTNCCKWNNGGGEPVRNNEV